MTKRQKMYPQLFPDPKREKSLHVAPLRKKPLKILDQVVPKEEASDEEEKREEEEEEGEKEVEDIQEKEVQNLVGFVK